MFDKFLEKQDTARPKEPPKKKKVGRPPVEGSKWPKRKTERHDAKGRVKPKERKGMPAGSKHWKVKRKYHRDAMRRKRARGHLAKDLAYNKTLRRKYIQNRSIARLTAKRKGVDPDAYYQITYEQWLLLWAEAPDVWDSEQGAFRRPAALAANPVKCRYNCCYFDRLNRYLPFEISNVAVFYRKNPLK